MKRNRPFFILLALFAFGQMAWAQTIFGGGSGTAADPYIIHSETHWNELATYVAEGNNTEGVYFKQDAQLYPHIMVGTSEHPFKGFYYSDSDSHQMGYTIDTDEPYAAPFHYVDGATISNLRVLSSRLTTSAKFAGGIIGHAKGEVHLNGCTIEGGDFYSQITSTVVGDGSHGGFVGYQESGDLIITNCLFAGKLIGSNTTHCGGFVGWSESRNEATVRLLYCLFTPSEVTMTGEYVFVRARDMDYVTLQNCYYSYAFGILQGELSNYANMGQGWTMTYPPTQPFNNPSIFATAIIKGLSSRYPYNLGDPISINFNVLRADGIELTQGTHYSALIKDSHDNAVSSVTDCGNYTLILTGQDPYYTNTLMMPFSVLQLGSEDNPYLIYSADDWNTFAENVNNGNSFSGKFFRLMENISVTTMVGGGDGSSNVFSGTFDGDGHIITFNKENTNTEEQYIAPFRRINGATINGIKLEGTVSSNSRFAGGIVAYAKGTSTITNCVNSTSISSSYSGTNASNGGIVGMVGANGTINITGCVFNGQMSGTTKDGTWSGILGLCNDNCTANISDCFIDPVSAVTNGHTIYRNSSGTTNCSNCYYTKTIGTAQGLKARTITGGENVLVAFAGSGDVYDVSGISGYNVGIVYNDVLYAGKSQSVQVDLTYTGSIPAHTSPVYTVTNGSLSGITLKLNSDNSSTVTINYDHYEIDEWGGTGTEDDPYLIYTSAQWNLLADRVSNEDNPNSYSGKYFKLMEDISINENHDSYQNPYPKLVGYGERSFQGTFDGNGHTIVLSYKNKSYQYEQAIALFPSVKNATIKRLTVDGYIYRDVCPHGIAGIVGSSYGTTNLISCRSSVDVQNDGDISPNNANGGGLVAYVESGTLNMVNCVFDGRLEGRSHTSTYAHLWGGMINYVRDGATANLINCLFNPEDIKFWDPRATATFARKHDNATVNLTNCYYKNDELGTTQGTSAIGWEDEQLLDALGYAWEYTSPAVFQPIMQPQIFTGSGTESSPYQIASAEDWDKLATYVAHKDSRSSDHFQMTNDISTTSMVGLFDNLTFKGTFDGGGNTLNVNYRVTSMPDKEISTAAPFAFIENATITDLHTTGSITTAGMRPAGVAGFVVGNSSITNCKSEVTLTSSHNDDIDAGGFVARVNKNKSITLTGCLFTGSITYSNPTGYEGGGMVGWTQENASASLTDCVFAPSAINITKYVTDNDDKKHRMFVGGKERGTLTNCYYNGVAAMSGMVAEGERVYDIIPGQNVTMQLYGIAFDYTVSGITLYSDGNKGLKFDNAFHAVSGNVLDLGLGVTVPYTVTNYLANGNIITFNTTWNNYTLTMPSEDVTISATFSDVTWDGEGTEESPYLIYYNVQWDLLATNVNAGNNYSGKYFKLMDDISVTTMVGDVVNYSQRSFNGTFDGGGHTLTFNKGTATSRYNSERCAPFGILSNATIKNLHTTGAIYTSQKDAAGIAVRVIYTSYFISCRSSMVIDCSYNGASSCGGFIASCPNSGGQLDGLLSIYFDDCLFDGALIGAANTTGWGGFIGYFNYLVKANVGNSGKVHFNRCLFAPTTIDISSNDAHNFVRYDAWGWSEKDAKWVNNNNLGEIQANKLYYTQLCGNASNQSASATQVGNMTNVQLRNKLGDNWMIVTEEAVEKVVPTMGIVVIRTITGYGDGNDRWAFIASPIEGSILPTDVTNLVGTYDSSTGLYDYDLYRFNPLANLEWENYNNATHHDGFNLVNGMGYLYATKTTKTLTFSGSFNTDTSKEITDLPAGFNLVGNPFTVDAYVSKPYYKMNNDGSAILADVQSIATPVPPCYGVIVQVDGSETVTFNTSGEFSAGPNNGSLKIALSQANTRSNAVMDNAIVSFNEGVELGKFYFGHQDANIYIPQGGEDYAIVSTEKQGEMPLNFEASENGTYTISVNPEGIEMAYLHLVDNMTGNDIDLLAGASTGSATYTFTAKTTDYESRFKLVFASIFEDADGDSGTFAFFSNGNWIIANEGKATLQVIDINGRILTNETVNGSVSKAINAAPGVYMLRLINGDDVKTQKIVVR